MTAAVSSAWARVRHLLRRRPPIIPPYTNPNSAPKIAVKIAFPFVLFVVCLVYGFYFALTAPVLLIPFAAPVALLGLLSVWALPASVSAPTRTMEFLCCAVLIGLILWPNYLALSLPGLPWITVIRITGFPLAFIFLMALSTTKSIRDDLRAMLAATPPIWVVMAAFVVGQFISLPFARDPPYSFNRILIQQVNWTMMFFLAIYICRTPGRAQRLINLICLLAIPIVVVSMLEEQSQKVLWVDNVPSFLKIDDPVAASLLGAHTRGATGLYRVKATFSTALGLAEYISLLTPFAIHYAVGPYSRLTKTLGVIALPVIFYIVRLTDARLGVVGFLGSFLLYSLFWALLRFRRTRGDLVSATIVYSYPTIAGALMIVINSSNRLNSLVFGGNAQNASNNARDYQLAQGVPEILQNPIGHGAANAGLSLGYAEGAFITVDNYYLTIGLDYGVFGLTCFLALFLIAIAHAVRWGIVSVDREDPELMLLMPLAAALAAFLVIKSVFSQPDNHPILFVFLGMIVALAYRAMQGDPKHASAAA